MIELFGARLLAIPAALLAVVVGFRVAAGAAWAAAFFACLVCTLSLVNAAELRGELGLAYALVNTAEAFLVALVPLALVVFGWRAAARLVRSFSRNVRGG